MVIRNGARGITAFCSLLGALYGADAAFSGTPTPCVQSTFGVCGSKRLSAQVYRGVRPGRTWLQSRNDDLFLNEEEPTEDSQISISSPANCNRYNCTALSLPSFESSRRATLLQMIAIATVSANLPVTASSASEIDSSGSMFSPKTEMIGGGGSVAARGMPLKQEEGQKREALAKTGPIQNIYETRFITYLARFLIVYDPAARSWWKKNTKVKSSSESPDLKARFAEFAESVEVGLADYFLGPYGSYASVAAAKAGINAAAPAKSARGTDKAKLWDSIFGLFGDGRSKKVGLEALSARKAKKKSKEETKAARQGVLNLFSLLKARYTSVEEKQQLAILFSFISSPELQPVSEIRGLLGEVDNGTIAEIEILDLSDETDDTTNFRLSSRQGGGFSIEDTNVVSVAPPPALGNEYRPAKVRTTMKLTSRILRINVVDGGGGYTIAPEVIVKPQGRGVTRKCDATAIINRRGTVTEIIVLDPGFGYGGKGQDKTIPIVEIRERVARQNPEKKIDPASAVAELEYKVSGVDVVDGGSGYLFDQPPEVSWNLPVDADWFVTQKSQGIEEDNQLVTARVSKMRSSTSDITVDTGAVRRGKSELVVDVDILRKLQSDPITLIPCYIRPQFTKFAADGETVIKKGFYAIPSLPLPPMNAKIPSPLYRSFDPLFGGVGKAPVTKSALELSPEQYTRLSLSGAICTVLVRTALNPLELVKTKVQLGNDKEILDFARQKAVKKNVGMKNAERTDAGHAESDSNSENAALDVNKNETAKIGTMDVVNSLVEIRGPLSLFQSADITFYTSVVFGLFGFGATELFRRSFSAIFFDETAASGDTNEFVLLAAAGIGTLLTCAAGAPFEILRVRSMSAVEATSVKPVLQSFVEENRLKKRQRLSKSASVANAVEVTDGLDFQLEDVMPLWSSFGPIVSRELPFAVTKFLVFDLAAQNIAAVVNAQIGDGSAVQVGVGPLGLLLSAIAGSIAGVAGAFVSHPADLILTLTSASSREEGDSKDWKDIIKELLSADGGFFNLYAGFSVRAVFFFLVIGLQFFLYDYVKTLLDVGTDDLTLVLDVFYAIRQGL